MHEMHMKHKVLKSIIDDLMKVPLGDDHGHPKAMHAEIEVMKKPHGMEDGDDLESVLPDEMSDDSDDAKSPMEHLKRLKMEKAIHGKHRG